MPKLLSIQCLSTGSSPKLQSKTVSPQTYSQTITADSEYDGLSSVIVNSSKTNKLFYKFLSTSTQTANFYIGTANWIQQDDSSITSNNWSINSNIIYIQRDDTSNLVEGAIKRVVVIEVKRNITVQLTCLYSSYYPSLYWKQGTNAILSSLQSNGSLILTAQDNTFFIGSYIYWSVALS